jgi:phosphate transport system substrate-binding protein
MLMPFSNVTGDQHKIMVSTRRTIATVALATMLVGCRGQILPATTTTTPGVMRIGTTTALSPLIDDITLSYGNSHPAQLIDSHYANYETMLRYLYDDEVTYFISSHLPPESQLWAAPIGQDAIVIISNHNSALDGLTTEQLRGIYQGQITSWGELGGQHEDIIVFSRENGSGTRAEFERMIMGRRQVTANAHVVSANSYIIASVADTPGSIGYVSMSYANESVKIFDIDGISPCPETIYSNLYPLRSTIFVIGLEEPGGHYRALIGWLQSPEGQETIAEHYSPLVGPGSNQK